MKHSNIYEERHSVFDDDYTVNYIITGEGVETFYEITHINNEDVITPSIIIRRYEA